MEQPHSKEVMGAEEVHQYLFPYKNESLSICAAWGETSLISKAWDLKRCLLLSSDEAGYQVAEEGGRQEHDDVPLGHEQHLTWNGTTC